MEINEELRDQIFEIIDNQIKEDNPPETKATFDRLTQAGYSEFVTKQLIGQCVAFELFHMLNDQEPFNNERYIGHLNNLPKEPLG